MKQRCTGALLALQLRKILNLNQRNLLTSTTFYQEQALLLRGIPNQSSANGRQSTRCFRTYRLRRHSLWQEIAIVTTKKMRSAEVHCPYPFDAAQSASQYSSFSSCQILKPDDLLGLPRRSERRSLQRPRGLHPRGQRTVVRHRVRTARVAWATIFRPESMTCLRQDSSFGQKHSTSSDFAAL